MRAAPEVRGVGVLAGLDDTAADGACTGEIVMQMLAVAAPDRTLQGKELLKCLAWALPFPWLLLSYLYRMKSAL